MSLRRTRADWPIVAAAGLITLLAAILLAAGPMYAAAAAESGLRRSLADAPVADTSVQVSMYADASDAQAVDAAVVTELDQVLAPTGGRIVRDWRDSSTVAIPDLPGTQPGDQALLGYLDELEEHATLVAGTWPADRAGAGEPLQVVVGEALAGLLQLHAGDEITMVAHPSSNPVEVPLRIVGIFAIDAAADPFWQDDEQLLAGRRENSSYATFGPFLTTRADLVQNAGVAEVRFRWRTLADYERLTSDGAALVRTRLNGLADRLQTAAGVPVQVATALPRMLAEAERSLLVSRTGVLLLMAQLGILAAYAITLTASLLVEHRRIDTALLRSRGAGALDVALLSLLEAVLIAIPAVLAAPWLAAAALDLLNVAGPLADAGLAIVPRVSADAYVAAAAAGIVAVALLVLPAALAARAFAAEQGGLSRHQTRTMGQRLGLDVALLAVTGIAMWQLRLYGAPLTQTIQGGLGLDPLLVAAPAIGLLAGGVLALRLLPLLAEAVEAAVSRGSGLVASLGSRQLARRPLRYTRSALLLMLALSMGVFAVSYAATWSTSQHDQAEFQAGADLRVTPARTLPTLPAWALPSAYAGLAGLEQAMPVERAAQGFSFAGAGSAGLLALDSGSAAAIVRVRPDAPGAPLGELLAALREGRPEPSLMTLPEGTAFLRVSPQIDRAAFLGYRYDPETDEDTTEPLPAADIRLRASAIVVDGQGLLYQVETGFVSMGAPRTDPVLALQPTDERGAGAVAELGATLQGPVRLAAIGLEVWLPANASSSEGAIGVAWVAAATSPDGPWNPLLLTDAGAWTARIAQGRNLFVDAPLSPSHDLAVPLDAAELFGGIYGGGRGPAARLSFVPASIAAWNDPVPVIVNRTFADEIDAVAGETVTATVEGAPRRFRVVGVVDTFPTTDPASRLLVLDQPTLGFLRLQGTSTTKSPTEWWMAAAGGQDAAIAAALRADPFESAEVVTVTERARSLRNDAVALGIVGALVLGSVATGLFAIVGLTVSVAVSARQRRTEFALLRALGISGRQLSGSLWLENASLVVVSLVAGTSLGLLIAWLVLPFVTVTQRATTPVPPVVVHVPWDQVLVLNAMSALALGAAVVVIGRVLRRIGVGTILRMGED